MGWGEHLERHSLYDNFGDERAIKDIARSHGDIEDLFVETEAIKDFLFRDPDYPVVVGSKGVGKSLLLFRKAVLVRKKSGVLVLPHSALRAYTPSFSFADSVRWTPFWKLLNIDGKPNLEAWGTLWEWALLITIFHGWLSEINTSTSPDRTRMLQQMSLLVKDHESADPFQLIAGFLSRIETRSADYKGRVLLPDAHEMREFVARHVDELSPVYLFIDNQDDFFTQRPEFWKASGYGSFLAIQKLHELSNHRVHCFLTLRPEVYWMLSESEHFPMWNTDVFRLRWRDSYLEPIPQPPQMPISVLRRGGAL